MAMYNSEDSLPSLFEEDVAPGQPVDGASPHDSPRAESPVSGILASSPVVGSTVLTPRTSPPLTSSPSSPTPSVPPPPSLPSLVPHGVHPLYYSLHLLRTRQYDRVIEVASAYRTGEQAGKSGSPMDPTTTPSSMMVDSDSEQLWFVQTKAMILNSWYNDVELKEEEEEEDDRDEGRRGGGGGGVGTAAGANSRAGMKTAFSSAATGPNATALVPLSAMPGGRPMSTRYGILRPGTSAFQATRPGQLPLSVSSRAGGPGKMGVGSRMGSPAGGRLAFSRSGKRMTATSTSAAGAGLRQTATSRYQRLGTASLQSVPGGPHIVLERLRLEKYAKERPMITKLLCDYLLYVEHRPRMVLELCRAVMLVDQEADEEARRRRAIPREESVGGGGGMWGGGGGNSSTTSAGGESGGGASGTLPPPRSPMAVSKGRQMFPRLVYQKDSNERSKLRESGGESVVGWSLSASNSLLAPTEQNAFHRGRSNPTRGWAGGGKSTNDDDGDESDNNNSKSNSGGGGGSRHFFSSPPPLPSAQQIGITASEDWWWKARYGKANYQLGLLREAEKWFQCSLFGGNGVGGGGGEASISGSGKKAFKEYHSSVVMELGKVYQRMDQPLSAMDLYHTALAHHPQDAAVARTLARLLEELHDSSAAFELFSSVLAYDSQNVEAIACVAAFYFYEKNQPECSLRFYRRLLQMGVQQPEVWNNMALSACLSFQFDLAFSYFGRALQVCEENRRGETMIAADVWYNISHAGIALGELAFAEKALWIAVRLDETHGEAWNNLAVLAIESGVLEMEKKKGSGKKRKKKKKNHHKEKPRPDGENDTEGGMKEEEEVEEDGGEEGEEEGKNEGGVFSSPFVDNVDEDTKEEATELLSMCLSVAPSLEEALYNSAWVQYALGELEEAHELLVSALEVHPDHPESLALLGVLRKRLHF